jgi:Fe-S-cluster containining protein
MNGRNDAAGGLDEDSLLRAQPRLWGCARCASIQRTCCQDTDVLVTPGDVERIARHVGRRDFWERRQPVDPDYLDQDDDPNWLLWTMGDDGARQVLKQRTDGDCGMLGAAGCVLPLDVRPLVCRLQPFEYTEQGLTGFDDRCPGAAIPPGESIETTLGLDRAVARRWHEILYLELRTGRPAPAGDREAEE